MRLGILFLLFSTILNSQVLYNNGLNIKINQNLKVKINQGDIVNQKGTISNSGILTIDGNLTNFDTLKGDISKYGETHLSGNLINNGSIISDSSLLDLSGVSQTLSGTKPINTYQLILSGKGKKSVQTPLNIQYQLSLKNSELAADNSFVTILNPTLSGISRDILGFVSTDSLGLLRWATNAPISYTLPLGTSRNGTMMYRPIMVTYQNSHLDTIHARFQPYDPSSRGFDINLKPDSICVINTKFYYQLDMSNGTKPNIDFSFQPSFDGYWDRLTNFNLNWNEIQNAKLISSIGSNSLDLEYFNYFKFQPISFATVKPKLSLTASHDTIHRSSSSLLTAHFTSKPYLNIKWSSNPSLSCENCISASANPFQTQYYYATLSDDVGCIVHDSIQISVLNPEVYFPNAFSPNGSGDVKNETFEFYTNANIKSGNYSIYDRWGEKVFYGDMIKKDRWDGRFKGELLSVGIYSYIAEYELLEGQKKKVTGIIHLMR